MSTSAFYMLAIIVGIVAGTYLPLNGKLGAQLGSPLLATTVFFIVGATAATLSWLVIGKGDTLSLLGQANPAFFALGLISFGIILSATSLIPRMGPGAYFVCIVAGQVLVGLTLSHFGWFSPGENH
ncbi:MAG: DMT family transporter, partial [Pseudomonadota bacterium]